MLSTKDLTITYTDLDPSRRKLKHPFAELYKIRQFCGPNAVKLQLTADMNIHDTANDSRLKKYTADPVSGKPPPHPVKTVRDDDVTIHFSYVMEEFTSHKRALGVNSGFKYQIKWEGSNNDEMTWEPADNLTKVKPMVEDYK